MAGKPTNLQPYGNSVIGGAPAPPPGTLEAAANSRALEKFNRWRTGAIDTRPAGPNWARLAAAGIVIVPMSALLLWLSSVLLEQGDATIAVIPAFYILVMLAILALIIVKSRPTKPGRALLEFYRSVGRGQMKRAQRLVLPSDLDGFPRYQPRLPDLGKPTGAAYVFDNPGGFKHYWSGLVRSRPAPYCFVTIHNVNVHEVAPGVAVVDFELKLVMNTSLWALLIFAALIIAVIVDLVTRRRVRVPMRKVMVKVGKEWRLFNGEWMGLDEHDLTWMRAAE